MSKAGDRYENPVTGEYGYTRIGTEDTGGKLLVSDLRVRPGGAVLGAHLHPTIDERFTVVSGKIGYMLDGKTGVLEAGQSADLPKGVPHDWWNAGDEEARVIVEIRPAARFAEMVISLFGLILGPTGVAIITDYVFADENMVHWSLGLVGVVSAICSAILLASILKPFKAERKALLDQTAGLP